MHRLFVALRPPQPILDQLAGLMEGVSAARWQDDAQLHLTIRYIGEVDRRMAEEVVSALDRLHAGAIDARLAGVGAFERGGRINALWAGVDPAAPLAALHKKVDHALLRIGLPPEGRAFRPHITVARLARGAGAGVEIARWQADHAGTTSATFRFGAVLLFESELGGAGAFYREVGCWVLRD